LAHLARRARRPTLRVGARQKLTEADSLDFAFFEDIQQFVKPACNFYRRRHEGKMRRKQQAEVWHCLCQCCHTGNYLPQLARVL
jgi:hypothetical protein